MALLSPPSTTPDNYRQQRQRPDCQRRQLHQCRRRRTDRRRRRYVASKHQRCQRQSARRSMSPTPAFSTCTGSTLTNNGTATISNLTSSSGTLTGSGLYSSQRQRASPATCCTSTEPIVNSHQPSTSTTVPLSAYAAPPISTTAALSSATRATNTTASSIYFEGVSNATAVVHARFRGYSLRQHWRHRQQRQSQQYGQHPQHCRHYQRQRQRQYNHAWRQAAATMSPPSTTPAALRRCKVITSTSMLLNFTNAAVVAVNTEAAAERCASIPTLLNAAGATLNVTDTSSPLDLSTVSTLTNNGNMPTISNSHQWQRHTGRQQRLLYQHRHAEQRHCCTLMAFPPQYAAVSTSTTVPFSAFAAQPTSTEASIILQQHGQQYHCQYLFTLRA